MEARQDRDKPAREEWALRIKPGGNSKNRIGCDERGHTRVPSYLRQVIPDRMQQSRQKVTSSKCINGFKKKPARHPICRNILAVVVKSLKHPSYDFLRPGRIV